jgi:predicted nucleic acid-binding Zn ribbon protein
MNQIRFLMSSVVDNEQVLQAAQAKIAMQKWPEIVGPLLAEKAMPDRYHRGTVWVAVESQIWAQELRMRKDQILSRLQAETSDPAMFTDIRFGVRPLPIPSKPEDPKPVVEETVEDCSIRAIANRRLAKWTGPRGR